MVGGKERFYTFSYHFSSSSKRKILAYPDLFLSPLNFCNDNFLLSADKTFFPLELRNYKEERTRLEEWTIRY